ncbi:MAG: hypothetical protein ORN58_03900 [Sediminibacterium sp.]|nr:hypothetical protein [Sediminibacterium sp.]
MKKKCLTIWLIGLQFCLLAQTNPSATLPNPAANTTTPKPNPPSFTWYGFARNDLNIDSRLSEFVREGQLNLWPKGKDIVNGKDFNDKSQLNILGILTRLGVKINGPDVLGAKLSGQIEGDFFGQAEANIGLLRLRHGFVKLEWTKSALLFGQTWYPLFIPEAFPGVVNFSTGIPIAPFGWAGQIKFSKTLSKDLFLHLTAYKPREFADASVSYANQPATSSASSSPNFASMNATLPELNAHIQYKSDKFILGAQIDYSVLIPYTKDVNAAGTAVINNASVSATTLMAYTKIVTKPVSIKAQFIAAEDATHWVMMGGFLEYRDANKMVSYKPTKTTSIWGEVYGNGKKWIPGIFIGYTSNDGANPGATIGYGRMVGISGYGIKDILRISPRIEYVAGKLKFGVEVEQTTANWGTRGNDGKVITGDATKPIDAITNTRFTFSTIYSF